MSDVLLIIGCSVLALIFGFGIAFAILFTQIKLLQKKIPKDMPDIIEQSKIEQKEVKDARENRIRENTERKRGIEGDYKQISDRGTDNKSTAIQSACNERIAEVEEWDKHDSRRPRRI